MDSVGEFLLWVLVVIVSVPLLIIAIGAALFLGLKLLFALGVFVGTVVAFAIGVCLFVLFGELFGFFPPGTFAVFWDEAMKQLGLFIEQINEARNWK